MMMTISTLFWQIMFILLFIDAGLEPLAWFAGGIVFMFWVDEIVSAKEIHNEQR
mgnify:FL=1